MAQVLEIVLAQGRESCIQRLREELERARMQAAENETRMSKQCRYWQAMSQYEERTADRAYSMLLTCEAHNALLAARLRELGHAIPAAPRNVLPFDYSDTESEPHSE